MRRVYEEGYKCVIKRRNDSEILKMCRKINGFEWRKNIK